MVDGETLVGAPGEVRDASAYLESLFGTRASERAIDYLAGFLAEHPRRRLEELRDEAAVARFAGEVAITEPILDPGTALCLVEAPDGYWAEGRCGGSALRIHGPSARLALRAALDAEILRRPS